MMSSAMCFRGNMAALMSRALCLRMHPDKHREDERSILAATAAAFQRVQAAWEVLQKWQWTRQRIWEQHLSTEDCDIPHDAEQIDEGHGR